ncbi:hypothetical protein [Parafrankia elaeagni]|uniref:hypothetical protein n=1 Tax=Parafrankia elaeagni TaxID=222534 RepID=UPI0012B5C166|nr:hypothetical protein [Parafrankia elaeagni]
MQGGNAVLFGRKYFLGLLGAAGGLILVLVLPWSRLPWGRLVVLLVLAAAVTGLILLRRPARRHRGFADVGDHFPPPAPMPAMAPINETRLDDVRVPSDTCDYYFQFSATVRWAQTDPHRVTTLVNQAAAACEVIMQRARQVTEKISPAQVALAAQELGGALGYPEPDRSGSLMVMAEGIKLALDHEDQERLRKLADLRKDEEIWQAQWRSDQRRRQHLADDVLRDTGSTVVWWLARNDHKVDTAVGDLHKLARLSAAANNRDLPDWYHRLDHSPARPTASDPSGSDDLGDTDNLGNVILAGPPDMPPETAAGILERLLDTAGLGRDQDKDRRLRRLLTDEIAEVFRDHQLDDFARIVRPTPSAASPTSPAGPVSASPPTDQDSDGGRRVDADPAGGADGHAHPVAGVDQAADDSGTGPLGDRRR